MEDSSIATSVRGSLELFQTLDSLPSPLRNASHQTALGSIADEESRFKVWSGNIGAHASGDKSLQFRLRDASHLRKQVLALLKDLSRLLENALAIIKGNKVPWDQDEDDDISDDELDSLEDASGDDELPKTELEQIACSVSDCVNCLLRLSVAIRNPAPHDYFTSSVAIDVSHHESFDIQHVRAKFQKIADTLAQRLGNAISRRRQYFKYRESDHLKLAHGLGLEDQADGKSAIAGSIPGHAKGSGFDNALPTIDEDAISDAGISQSSFESPHMGTEKFCIPPLPKSAESGPYECPLCFMIITATNRVSWKRHVFADLRPYICLSEDCAAADKWFATRLEWILHEMKNHWKSYTCPYSCNETFPSRSRCIEHVHKSHPSTTPERQLEATISLSSRPISVEDGMPCPMCHESLDSVKSYQSHVGRHHEQLAMFALPSIQSQDIEDDLDEDMGDISESDAGSETIDTPGGQAQSEELRVDDGSSTRESHSDVSRHMSSGDILHRDGNAALLPHYNPPVSNYTGMPSRRNSVRVHESHRALSTSGRGMPSRRNSVRVHESHRALSTSGRGMLRALSTSGGGMLRALRPIAATYREYGASGHTTQIEPSGSDTTVHHNRRHYDPSSSEPSYRR